MMSGEKSDRDLEGESKLLSCFGEDWWTVDESGDGRSGLRWRVS
jgi:hypothetical protein